MQRGRGRYHHYIPRFILRGFAVSKPSRCFTDDGNGAFIETKLKLNRWVPNPTYDRMNVYHLEGARLIMASDHTTSGDFTNTVDRNFGLRDLYVDESHPDSEHIENSLSKLEFEASKVVKAAIAALESPEQEFRLPRRDLNTLRKFLFIMSYRFRRGKQFLNNCFDAVTRRDIDHHIKMFLPEGSTARDVWLQNIKEILDTDYWLIPENPRIFVHDRSEVASDMRERHIVFWRSTAGREFITCNGFGLVDAAIRVGGFPTAAAAAAVMDDMKKMGSVMNDYTPLLASTGTFEWFQLYPLHPKLSIALVHNFVSSPPPIRLPWDLSRYHTMPQAPTTVLYVGLSRQAERAWKRNRLDDYKVPKDQMGSACTYLDGKLLESRVNDIFVFPLIQLDAEQTHRFNAMFLENANDGLVFVSPAQLYRSIIHYETSTIWAHKRDYRALKAALRSFSQRTHTVLSSPADAMEPTFADNADRRLVWLSSPRKSPEDPPQMTQIITFYRRARRSQLHGLGGPAMSRDEVFAHLNRTHMDSLFRNEESERARRENAAAEQPSPEKPRPIPVLESQESRVPASTSMSPGKKPADVQLSGGGRGGGKKKRRKRK